MSTLIETFSSEIRVAEGGVTVNLACGCGQELGVDYYAIEPREIDQPTSFRLMAALRRRLSGGNCPGCGGTIAALAEPAIDNRTHI